jgi:Icc protein
MNRPDNVAKSNDQQLGVLPPGALRITQITDTHLFADPQGCLLGINTLDTLNEVLKKVAQDQYDSDLALVTGDLVHDTSPAGYKRLVERLNTLERPTYCIPGNHDDPAILNDYLNNSLISTPDSKRHGNWLLVMLNSNKPGEEGGHLNQGELDKLEAILAAESDAHTLIALHHNPVPVGCRWLDPMQVENSDDFFAILDRHPQVRGVIWGHIHQAFESERKGVQLLGCPSTCFQFEPGAKDFKLASVPPGYRQLALLPDGEIRSQVVYVDNLPAGLDANSSGY